MKIPEPRRFALLLTRRVLGIAAFLYLFYVAAHYAWDLPFPTVRELVTILFVVILGVGLGVAFSRVWPLPQEKGWPRAIRTALLTIPALGIGIFVQVTLAGPQAGRAFYAMFAMAAWLGSGFIEEEEPSEQPSLWPFRRRSPFAEDLDDSEP